MKIERLTSEQEAKIPIYLKRYYDKVYNSKPINKKLASDSIKYLYKNAGFNAPFIWYVESPLMAQIIANLLTNKKMSNPGNNLGNNIGSNIERNLRNNLRNNIGGNIGDNFWNNLWNTLGNNIGDNIGINIRINLRRNLGNNLGSNLGDNIGDNIGNNLWSNLGNNIGDNIGINIGINLGSNLEINLEINLGDNLGDNPKSNLGDNLGSNLGSNIESNLRNNLRNNIGDNIGSNLEYYTVSYYGNLSDYGWTCFYDFINNELMPSYNLEIWDKWKQLIESNIYDMIQLDGLCIVMSMPNVVKIDNLKRLHSENSYAVSWEDGYEVYSWHGVIVPKKWITQKEIISKDDILKESNAEKRRCLREILGAKRYFELLGGVNILDEIIDSQGNPMRLYESKDVDQIINKKLQFLHVICPSTKREYFLYPPSQNCKTAREAKANTFGKKEYEFNPIYES